MTDGSATPSSNGSEAPDRWTARKVRPIVILYVLGVFAVFIVLAVAVFDSRDAVKGLVVAAVGSVIAILPGVAERIEYRATVSRVEKRTQKKTPAEYEEIFRWDELSRVVAMRHGFKYFKILDEPNRFRRFLKMQISDQCSGEVHVEQEDLDRVLDIVSRQGIAISRRRVQGS